MNDQEIDLQIARLKKNKEQNKLFRRLSPSEKRVAVAKDALKQVTKGVWSPRGLTYVYFDQPQDLTQTCSFEDVSCEVCARGALFLGAINKFNNYDPKQFFHNYANDVIAIDASDFGDVEDRLWSKAQICLIESVFEMETQDIVLSINKII